MRAFGRPAVLGLVVALALAGCGEDAESILAGGTGGTGGSTGGTGGGTGGTGGSAGDAGGGTGGGTGGSTGGTGGSAAAYTWLAIVDNEPIPTCTGTGPGADIDAVELKRGGTKIGAGLTGSASYLAVLPGTSGSPCGMCGPETMMVVCPHSGMTAAPRVEGSRDGMSFANMPDTGYMSLNGGVVWVQIGNASGAAPAQALQTGDTLTVHEVDKLYVADMSANGTCTCAPEKYKVYAYVTMGDATTRKQLTATSYRTANMDCGAVDSQLGCGTTDFTVP